MNELLVRRHVKDVMRHGVPKLLAEEIVNLAIETGKGNNVSSYINYAMNLIYGFAQNTKTNTK
ncbi:hypothetical protein PQE66_gp023 [Bacillus phage PBC2]|uniref:Uncharacterized protein n=1 Tax=Bacillus phage PBC2 TaxID=1675029 RepID=A0A218KBS4_9CAUD|nr:hypothetical protein PQE66_gp023 [Bacillus phage PBC2]AKQ08338.1 hypothetical protein PBC2_023 [Bacillus phage PBC2]